MTKAVWGFGGTAQQITMGTPVVIAEPVAKIKPQPKPKPQGETK